MNFSAQVLSCCKDYKMESEVSPAMKGSDGKGACLSQAGQLLCVVGIISWSVQQDVLKKGKVPFGEFIETA